MKQTEFLEALKKGDILYKRSVMKSKRGKIVRGTFYQFYLGEERITENQYIYIRNNFNLRILPDNSIERRYQLNET